MNVYCRIDGKMAMFEVDSDCVDQARRLLNAHLIKTTGSVRLSETRWSHGPVLALVPLRRIAPSRR